MASLRAEIFRGGDSMDTAIAGTTVAVTGTASAAWAPPYAGSDSDRFSNPGKVATFEAFGGPVYVAIGENPNPATEPRRLVRPGVKVEARIHAGDRLSAIAAADVPA